MCAPLESAGFTGQNYLVRGTAVDRSFDVEPGRLRASVTVGFRSTVLRSSCWLTAG
jgi:hypothetical protein